MTKSLLGTKSIKRAYLIGSDRAHKEPEFSQDTAKEDFILCDSCEKYFSILETYIATRVHNRLWDIRYADQFKIIENEGYVSWKVCENVDPLVFRLLIYSILWRCSISNTDLCKDFFLSSEEEETLRSMIYSCMHLNQQDLLANIEQYSSILQTFPFIFLTAESFADKTPNTLFVNPLTKNPYQLILNEYILVFSFDHNSEQQAYGFLNNFDHSMIKIGFLTNELWKSLNSELIQMVSSRAASVMKTKGQVPWIVGKKQG